jgi:hypothetical protein
MLPAALLLGLATACRTIDYAWTEQAIADDGIQPFAVRGPVALVNASEAAARRRLGRAPSTWSLTRDTYRGSYRDLSQAVVTQIGVELRKRGTALRDDAPKFLRVQATGSHLEPVGGSLRAHLQVVVRTGSGYERKFWVRSQTQGSGQRALDGAVALAVIDILEDFEVRDYLAR